MSVIYVDVRPQTDASGNLANVSVVQELFETRIDEIADSLGEIAKKLQARIDTLLPNSKDKTLWTLEEIELKFTMDLEAEAGVVIARTKASAGFEASLKWKKDT